MPKSDWRKLEALLEKFAREDQMGLDRPSLSGDLIAIAIGPINLTELAQDLADHVTITLSEPIQVKS